MDSQFLLFVVASYIRKEVDLMTEYPVESSIGVAVDLEKRKQIRVLHVDDEPGPLKTTEQYLKMQGQFHSRQCAIRRRSFRKITENEV